MPIYFYFLKVDYISGFLGDHQLRILLRKHQNFQRPTLFACVSTTPAYKDRKYFIV